MNPNYGLTPADCGACGGPVMNRAGKWECSVCGIPTDYDTGESGVSRGNPSMQKVKTITLNGGLNTQDLRTPAQKSDTLAALIEAEEADNIEAVAQKVRELVPSESAKPEPQRSGKRK